MAFQIKASRDVSCYHFSLDTEFHLEFQVFQVELWLIGGTWYLQIMSWEKRVDRESDSAE